MHYNIIARKENGFAEVSKNLARYRSENNFVWIIKIIRMLKLVARMLKLFAASINVLRNYFDGSTKLFSDL